MLLIGFLAYFWAAPSEFKVETADMEPFVSDITDIVATLDNEIYFLDRWEFHVFHLDASGKKKNVFGRKGEGPGEMSGPFELQYLPGKEILYVSDHELGTLVAFSREGKPLKSEIPGRYEPLVIGELRYVYIKTENPFVDSEQGAKVILEDMETGKSLELLHLDVTRHNDPTKITHKGGRGFMYFPWYPRTMMAVSPDKQWLFLGSSGDARFQVYHVPEGRIKHEIKVENAPSPLLKEEEIEGQDRGLYLNGKIFNAKDFNHPNFKALVDRIMVDTSQRLWIQMAGPWQAAETTYRVYAHDGKPEGRISLPSPLNLFHADGEAIWVYSYQTEKESFLIEKRPYRLEQSPSD